MQGLPHRLRKAPAPCAILALPLAACLALAGCVALNGAQPLSDSGYPVAIVIARQPVYLQSTCSGATSDRLDPGSNVVDLGTMGTNCEEIVYQSSSGYTATGYLPVYGMRHAAGGVRCRADVGCALRAGPAASYTLVGRLGAGDAAKGYGTTATGAIMTDSQHFDWWEVVDPATGARADLFAPAGQAF